jgi:hypothetical protein
MQRKASLSADENACRQGAFLKRMGATLKKIKNFSKTFQKRLTSP